MTLFNFVFLSRNWAQDQKAMEKSLALISELSQDKLALLIFPEGTNLSENTYARTKQFAEKTGRQLPRNVLLPHATGLRFCMSQLVQREKGLYLLVRRDAAVCADRRTSR